MGGGWVKDLKIFRVYYEENFLWEKLQIRNHKPQIHTVNLFSELVWVYNDDQIHTPVFFHTFILRENVMCHFCCKFYLLSEFPYTLCLKMKKVRLSYKTIYFLSNFGEMHWEVLVVIYRFSFNNEKVNIYENYHEFCKKESFICQDYIHLSDV